MHSHYGILFLTLNLFIISTSSAIAIQDGQGEQYAICSRNVAVMDSEMPSLTHRMNLSSQHQFGEQMSSVIAVTNFGFSNPRQKFLTGSPNRAYLSGAFSNYSHQYSSRISYETTRSNGNKIITEMLAGAGSGLLLALGAIALSPGEEDGPLFLSSVAYVLGVPIGVSLVGNSGQGSGSTAKSFIGSFLGGVASLPVILFVWDKESLAALGAISFFSFPVAGATIGFNLGGQRNTESVNY